MQLDLFPDEEPSAAAVPAVPRVAAPPDAAADKAVRNPGSADAHALRARLKSTAEALRRELEAATRSTITLAVTNNTSNMMSVVVEPGGGMVKLRLHHMFLDAPHDVRRALAHWIQHPKSRKYASLFRNFIVSRNHQIQRKSPAPARIRTRGAVYDLRDIFDEVNASCFQSRLTDVAITWGRESSTPVRSIRFGSYYEADRLIRIHPRLDQAFVPSYVVRYIVFHEMLHAHLGVGRNKSGRRRIHPPGFKNTEMSFPDYPRAVAWIEDSDNLHRLLRRRRQRKQE